MAKSIREKIYQKVRDRITYGFLNPGERLIEESLVKEFKVSRTPIRESLRQLENEGLITFERNKGFTVSKLSPKQVDEIYRMRWLLEGYASRLTAEKASERDVTRLRELNERLKGMAQDHDLMGWLQFNTMFHDYLCDHCGNGNLISIIKIIQRRIYRYKYITISIPGYMEHYIGQHEGIISGCEKNDGEMAEAGMRDHLETVRRLLLEHLNKSYPTVTYQ
jgi:DNA-binding GntR family transcriptional regulator